VPAAAPPAVAPVSPADSAANDTRTRDVARSRDR
jgi:hypothetical protein